MSHFRKTLLTDRVPAVGTPATGTLHRMWDAGFEQM